MDRVPIGYAFPPRLRGRLTLGRLPLPRKPYVFGGRESHPSLRYLYLHSHFPCLQRPSRAAFSGLGNAPLPPGAKAPGPQLRYAA